jgi:Protein of unknown function (DUF3352)
VIRRAAIVLAALAALAALLVAGCGGGGGGSDGLASLAPPDAPLYVESVVRPEGEQRDAIESLSSRVAGIDDPGAAIVQQLDRMLSESGTSYEDDIAPWLGERAAVFAQSFRSDAPFAAIVQSTDTGATEDFLQKAAKSSPDMKQGTYKDVRYYWSVSDDGVKTAVGVVDDFLVAGMFNGFKAAVDASEGGSLADSSHFDTSTSTLPDDNVALGYVDGELAGRSLAAQVSDPLQATVMRSALQTLANGPVSFAVSATPDAATLDLSLPSSIGLNGGDLVGQAPADSWFAVGVQGVGGILGNALETAKSLQLSSIEDQIQKDTGVDPKDAASWMHNGYASVAGTSEKTIHIGAVVGSSDPKASAKDIRAARERVEADADAKLSPTRVKGADTGFSAEAPESPQAIDVAQVGDQVVAALGPGRPGEEELHPKRALADDPTFKSGLDALGSDFPPLAFISLTPFFDVAEQGGSANDPNYRAAKPYLEKLDYLIAGSSAAEGRTTVRLVVGAK